MTTGESYRCFIAVEIEEPVRQHMLDLQEHLRGTSAELHCPAADDLHLTLLFLGITPAADVPRLAALMDGVAQFQSPFKLESGGVDIFGPPSRPRVLWVGIQPHQALARLQRVLAEGVQRLGHPLEAREFVPHLTLARVRRIGNDRSLTSAVESIKHTALGTTTVSRIVLMRSMLEPIRPHYSVLHASPLKGTPNHAPESRS